MLNESIVERLVSLFWKGIEGYDYESWNSLSSKDKEEMVIDVMAKYGDEVFYDVEELSVEEVYKVFWEWESGLEESSFDVIDDFYGLTEEQYNFIIDSFRQCLTGFTYESWCDTGSSDKEEYVVEATKESCPFEIEDDGVLYDIFWDWAHNLEEEDFSEPEEDEDDDYLNQDFDDYEDEEEDDDDWY